MMFTFFQIRADEFLRENGVFLAEEGEYNIDNGYEHIADELRRVMDISEKMPIRMFYDQISCALADGRYNDHLKVKVVGKMLDSIKAGRSQNLHVA